MTPMIWLICRDDFSILPMASTARRTIPAPSFGVVAGGGDIARARLAPSALLPTAARLAERRGGLFEARRLLSRARARSLAAAVISCALE